MVGIWKLEEVIRNSHAYLSLSEDERAESTLFEFWDYLFFRLATSRESAPDAWSVIKGIAELGLTDQQFVDLAAGPFEEMLVSLDGPLPDLFSQSDVDLAKRLARYVSLTQAKESVRDWITGV